MGDCVGLLVDKLKDAQLAIVVLRLRLGEGDQTCRPILTRVMEQRLEAAADEHDVWMESSLLWLLKRCGASVQVLCDSLQGGLRTSHGHPRPEEFDPLADFCRVLLRRPELHGVCCPGVCPLPTGLGFSVASVFWLLGQQVAAGKAFALRKPFFFIKVPVSQGH